MLSLLFYCLKVLLCSGLLFGYYLVALHNKQFHEWNRYYLLMIVLLSFILPFLHIPIFFNANNNGVTIILRGLSFGNYGDEIIVHPKNNWQINWNKVLIILYAGISIFFLIKLLKTFNWINKLKSNYPSEMLDEIQFYNTNEAGTPFSFFKNIFWHKSIEPSSSKGLQMLRHEITHVRQLHSADKLLMEIITIIAWWNPFFHLIKKELSTIHEFIADQHAANGDDHLQYASLLLQKAFGSNNIPLSNQFFHSQLKRRIAMLTTIKNPRFSYLRRLMVLPLAAALFMLFAFRYKKINFDQLKSPTQITVVIDAGHGGSDDGATANGLKEKDITLAISQELATLASAKNIKIILTRSTDGLPAGSKNVEDGLKQRIAIGTNSGADLFISLHINTSNLATASGISAFVSKTGNNSMGENQLIASSLLDELQKSGLHVFNEIQQSKEQGIFILDKNPLPAVLLEIGFLNNPTDAAFIADPKNQEKIANEILDGIVNATSSIKKKSTISNIPIFKNQENKKVLATNIIATKTEREVKPFANTVFKSDKDQKNNDTVKADANKTPLYILDGKEISPEYLKTINPNKIEEVDVLKDKATTDTYGEKAKNGVVLIWLKKQAPVFSNPIAVNAFYQDSTLEKNKKGDYEKTFTKVEEPATFPGGLDGWRNYLTKNLQYPEAAQKKNIQGVVKVQLVVDKQGHVSDVKALNDLGGELSEEAERVIKTGPEWVPAKQNGKLVTYKFVQTLTFQLK